MSLNSVFLFYLFLVFFRTQSYHRECQPVNIADKYSTFLIFNRTEISMNRCNKILSDIVHHKAPPPNSNGLIERLHIKHHAVQKCQSSEKNLLICVMLRNQADIINDFLATHYIFGAHHIVIYDDESIDNLKEVLQPWIEIGFVTFKSRPKDNPQSWWSFIFDKKPKRSPFYGHQTNSYMDCFENFAKSLNYKWVAFIDTDERIIPLKDECYHSLLKRYENIDSLGSLTIPWSNYDNPYYNDLQVFKTLKLTYAEMGLFRKGLEDRESKQIARVDRIIGPTFNMPHCVNVKPEFQAMDQYLTPIQEPCYHSNKTATEVVVKHYRLISIEEATRRSERYLRINLKPQDFLTHCLRSSTLRPHGWNDLQYEDEKSRWENDLVPRIKCLLSRCPC